MVSTADIWTTAGGNTCTGGIQRVPTARAQWSVPQTSGRLLAVNFKNQRTIKSKKQKGKKVIVGIHHVALGVSDFEKALRFYTEGLGFELVQESEFDNSPEVDRAIGLAHAKARMAMLKGPNAFLELWQYTNPEPKDLRSRPCDYGYPHFALQVDDIQV